MLTNNQLTTNRYDRDLSCLNDALVRARTSSSSFDRQSRAALDSSQKLTNDELIGRCVNSIYGLSHIASQMAYAAVRILEEAHHFFDEWESARQCSETRPSLPESLQVFISAANNLLQVSVQHAHLNNSVADQCTLLPGVKRLVTDTSSKFYCITIPQQPEYDQLQVLQSLGRNTAEIENAVVNIAFHTHEASAVNFLFRETLFQANTELAANRTHFTPAAYLQNEKIFSLPTLLPISSLTPLLRLAPSVYEAAYANVDHLSIKKLNEKCEKLWMNKHRPNHFSGFLLSPVQAAQLSTQYFCAPALVEPPEFLQKFFQSIDPLLQGRLPLNPASAEWVETRISGLWTRWSPIQESPYSSASFSYRVQFGDEIKTVETSYKSLQKIFLDWAIDQAVANSLGTSTPALPFLNFPNWLAIDVALLHPLISFNISQHQVSQKQIQANTRAVDPSAPPLWIQEPSHITSAPYFYRFFGFVSQMHYVGDLGKIFRLDITDAILSRLFGSAWVEPAYITKGISPQGNQCWLRAAWWVIFSQVEPEFIYNHLRQLPEGLTPLKTFLPKAALGEMSIARFVSDLAQRFRRAPADVMSHTRSQELYEVQTSIYEGNSRWSHPSLGHRETQLEEICGFTEEILCMASRLLLKSSGIDEQEIASIMLQGGEAHQIAKLTQCFNADLIVIAPQARHSAQLIQIFTSTKSRLGRTLDQLEANHAVGHQAIWNELEGKHFLRINATHFDLCLPAQYARDAFPDDGNRMKQPVEHYSSR